MCAGRTANAAKTYNGNSVKLTILPRLTKRCKPGLARRALGATKPCLAGRAKWPEDASLFMAVIAGFPGVVVGLAPADLVGQGRGFQHQPVEPAHRRPARAPEIDEQHRPDRNGGG